MQLNEGRIAVVTGAANGIGLALAQRFARAGMKVVLADVEETRLEEATASVSALGVEAVGVPTDVSDQSSVQALAATAMERFGAVHVLCNNAGVAARSDPWFGPLSAWEWVFGVNLWGVIHGVRAFLPHMATQAEGHIVNTASMAGLVPGVGPVYDATKHAVVAITEDLYRMARLAGLPIGVSVLCPGWVRTGIVDADRNWPDRLGERPPDSVESAATMPIIRRVIDEGTTPAAVADLVADAVEAERFWVFTGPEWLEVAVRRWHGVADGHNPDLDAEIPGMPPAEELMAQVMRALGTTT
ncbi:MAG TPA: SDR family NAD(P)-dependent oxidoreductase [Acidimicrobiales bacterium]|nr:SDR family NAD(P)-dependent oxidoreductase [Acidimicrobiales bacterium]